MEPITLPSRPADGPQAVIVSPAPKSGPGERHVTISLRAGKGPERTITARFRDVPSREGLIAVLVPGDDRRDVTDLQELGLAEAHTLPIRLDGKRAEICIARGALLQEVLKAQGHVPRPAQGATVAPPKEDEAPAPAKRKRAQRDAE